MLPHTRTLSPKYLELFETGADSSRLLYFEKLFRVINSNGRHEPVPTLVKINIKGDLRQSGNRAISPKVGALRILTREVGTQF